jgi:integrase
MNRDTGSPRTVADLVTHYQEKELPEDSSKAYSTRKAYRCYFKNWIVPVWGSYRLSAVKTVAVEDWLRTQSLAPGTKAKMRNIMSALFTHAMRYEWTDRNPIKLVRQSAKRQSTPDVLTAEELRALLNELDGPYYVMALMAAVTGLRVSELLALKWSDIDFTAAEIHLQRAIVCQHVGALKTEFTEACAAGLRTRRCAAGLESTLPLQSKHGLRLRIC